jgi:hypothetical protein
MNSFSFDYWVPTSKNGGESVLALPKRDTSRILNQSAAKWTETHGERARLCWHRSKRHFWPSISYLADAFRHGALHLTQRSIVFLRHHLRRKSGTQLSTRDMNILLLLLVLLVLSVGGGFYFGGPIIGGGGIGLILLVCLIVYVMGGFRSSKS